ncbi:zinc-binding protein A33-like isoform X3 [Scyliorhinus canicula]|uniref:zinc-binding protein A33-like isoform X3 n=1 Tax=Scyliorhinus canicula TaxID=7830 RepID=UPI0018F6F7AD|nr:zinc-binding protein A33-like isoform X3 [Scyliorhinus canicula]
MALRQQVQSLTEETICSICLDFFTDPVTLDCGHNFCRSCISQCWENKEINSCPECREVFPERNLRINRALGNLAEKTRKFKLNRKEKESKLHCEEHQEELKLFCETDKKLICLICRDSQEHKSHNFLPIKEAIQSYKDQLKSSLDSLTVNKSAVLQMEQKQKGKISEVGEQSSSLQTHITSEFSKMHQILTEKEQRLLRDLRGEEERIREPMEKNLREIQENLNSIEEKLSKLQKQMEQKDELIFLKDAACRKRRISDELNELSVVDAAPSFGKFKGPLQYRVWREINEQGYFAKDCFMQPGGVECNLFPDDKVEAAGCSTQSELQPPKKKKKEEKKKQKKNKGKRSSSVLSYFSDLSYLAELSDSSEKSDSSRKSDHYEQ